jgi:hypothetical protein
MNNRQCVVNLLLAHRQAMRWTDEAVADDVLRQLDLDPEGEAKNATPVFAGGITEDEVVAHETAAQAAVDKATAARAQLKRQNEPEADEGKPWLGKGHGQVTSMEQARLDDAKDLGLPPSATRAQIDAEFAKREAEVHAAPAQVPFQAIEPSPAAMRQDEPAVMPAPMVQPAAPAHP